MAVPVVSVDSTQQSIRVEGEIFYQVLAEMFKARVVMIQRRSANPYAKTEKCPFFSLFFGSGTCLEFTGTRRTRILFAQFFFVY